jgi:intracellular multiplication protein IcmJ
MRHPLKLAANFIGWKIFCARKADPAFLRFSEKVFKRDNYTCQFCGFQAREYQEVINLDQDYSNSKLSNVVTSCCFCAQCFFIESVGLGDFGGGTLIYMPEIPQASLNSFCHVLFCAITNNTGYKASAEAVYRSIKLRSQQLEEQFGEGTSEPSVLGRLFIDSRVDNPALNESIEKYVRLLPSRARFKTQIERWAASALEELAANAS